MRVEEMSISERKRWDADVFVEEDGEHTITHVTVEAESEDGAVRRAMEEIRRALAFLNPLAKIVGARARRQEP
jgi:hypothetical protein